MNNTLKELRGMFEDGKVFVVGGAVRDFLEGKEPKDLDLVTTLPEQYLYNMGARFIDPKSSFPVFFLNHPVLGKLELAYPRREFKEGNGHRGFRVEFGDVSLEEDLSRRDFTINSMALGLDGKLIDPFDGAKHLRERVLTHTSHAFVDDPLRVFRAFRFAAKGFHLTRELSVLIQGMESELATLPVERVFAEMMKAMAEERPEMFFVEMVRANVARELFREVHRMSVVPAGPQEHHPEEDLFVHACLALNMTSTLTADPVERLASFLHDMGKLETPPELWPAHHDHEARKTGDQFLARLKADGRTRKVCAAVAHQHMRFRKMLEMRPAKRLRMVKGLLEADAFDAVRHLMNSDTRENLEKLFRAADLCAEALKLNVCDLGLDMANFKNEDGSMKPGEMIKQMVEDRRISKLKEMR